MAALNHAPQPPTERNTQNEYVPTIAHETSRKSHSNHDIITIEKRE